MVLLLVFLSLAVKQGLLVSWDRAIAEWVVDFQNPALDQAARILTWFGSSFFALLLASGMALGWWFKGRCRNLFIFTGAWLVGFFLHVLLRLWVGQLRPDVYGEPQVALTLLSRIELAGFPSGHAFHSAFLYGWWAQALPYRRTPWAWVGLIGCVFFVLLIGATRVYLQRHWPSDVLGAWLLAGLALALTRNFARQIPERS